MNNRRNFLGKLIALSSVLTISSSWRLKPKRNLSNFLESTKGLADQVVAQDEAFWKAVRAAYTISPSLINLNNGGVSPQPRVVQEAVEKYNAYSNETPTYYMWRILDKGRERIRAKLAKLAGCSAEEIAINRNATEGIETIIFGLPLQAGDEVVLTKQDYPAMILAWEQRAKRDGIVLKWLSIKDPNASDEELTSMFVDAFTPKTKLVHLTHVINWNGQILPVKKIAQQAKAKGIEVLVDAAHSFAQLDYKIADLNCDYWATSLHKWLCAPFGTGMLYVKKDKINKVYPLFAAPKGEEDNIRKFEHLGTRSIAIEQGIGQAVEFHEKIGVKRKQARLRYLRDYWIKGIKDLPGVSFGCPTREDNACGIGIFAIEGAEPSEIHNFLFRKFRVHSTTINWENIHGVRISPNIYTTLEELDTFIAGVEAFTKRDE